MKRVPIVAIATIAGLAGVLTFHTKSAPLTLGIAQSSLPSSRGSTTTSIPAGPPTNDPSSSASSPSTTIKTPSTTPTTPSSTATSTPASTSIPPASTSTSTTTTTPSTSKTAVGSAVNYNYGVLSVSVTATGKKITNVQIASLDDGGNFRSESIDQQSIPILEQEALQAQNSNIQSVSGASYTSSGFQQSLQSALTELGIQ